MKRLITLLMLLTPPFLAAQQVSRYDNIAIGNVPGGQLLQALPNAMITVQGCGSMSTSCTQSPNLCSGITDTSCGLPGLLYADSGGNYHFYARAGRYQVTITASGFQARTINDVILPLSASDGGSSGGGTSVTVNGTAAVPNALNFSSILLPPANGTVINFLLNGNNAGAYLAGNGNAANCLSGTGTWVSCGDGGGGAGFTVNGTTPTGTVNFNASTPLPPPNGINVNWTLVGTNLTAAIVGDGNPNSCLIGTGIFAACPGGGGGGGSPLPTIPQYNLYASNGSGGAQDSGAKAGLPGFIETEVLLATGDVTSQAAPFQLFPNASVEYFPTGYAWSGGTVGAAHGFAGYFSHSAGTTASANGGIGLGGGNSGGTGNQIYLDCEIAGCDFKVPLSVNGSAVGGGGTAGVSSINGVAGAFNFTGSVSCASTTCNFTGTGGGGSGTVASGTGNYFAWYPSTGTTVNSNPNLSDNGALITSQEPLAAPGISVTGTGGIAMTGAGGTLPTPASGQGGIGIGPGNVPQYYSNGGAWTAIGTGGAAGVSSINGTTGAFTFGGAGVSCATTTCTFSGGTSLPTITANNIYVSNGSGGAQDSNVQAAPNVGGTGLGVIKSGSSLVSGLIGGTSPFTGSNGSQEWYGVNGVIGSVTVPNGAVLIMGNSASTAGPTGNGGVVLGGNSATTTPSKEVFVDCEHVGCDFKVPLTLNGGAVGGSGTVSPNSGTAGVLAYYPAAGGSTSVSPAGMAAVSTTNYGINLGLGLLQFGTSLTTNDVGLSRLTSGILGIGTGSANGESNYLRSGNSCALITAITFTNTGLASALCQKGFASGVRAWIVHCVVPWSFTAGSGTVTTQIGVSTSTAQSSAAYWTAILWGGTAPATQVTQVPTTSGTTWVMTSPSLTYNTTQFYTWYLDGLITSSSSATTTFSVTLQSTAAGVTGQVVPGAYCRFE